MESHIVNLRHSENKGRKSEKSFGFLSEKSKMLLAIYIDRIVELFIYAIVFFVPFFLLSFSGMINEASEAFVFLFLSGFILFIWILSGVFLKKKFVVAKSFLTLSFLLFTLVVAVSAILGVDRASSFFGIYGNPVNSLMVYGSLFAFYFVAASLIAEKGSRTIINNLLKSFLVSSLFLMLAILCFYLDLKCLAFLKGYFFASDVISDPKSVAIYIVAAMFVALYGYKNFVSEDLVFKVVSILTVIFGFIGLVFIDWSIVWPIMFALLSAALVLGAVFSEKNERKPDVFVGVLAVLSLLFVFSSINFSEITSGKIILNNSSISTYINDFLNIRDLSGNEMREGFSAKTSSVVAYQTLQAFPAFGSGVGTYYYDFAKYKPLEFNYEENWNIRFTGANNELLEKISTIGLAGMISFVILLLIALSVLWKNIGFAKENRFITLAFIGLIIFQAIYIDSIVSKFIFVFLLVLAFSKNLDGAEEMRFASNGRKREYSGKHYVFCVSSEGQNSALYACALILMVVGGLSSYFAIQFFRADALYAKIVQQGDVTEIKAADLEKVVKITPYKGWYEMAVSKIYVSRLNFLLNSKAQSQEALEKVKNESDKALSHSRRAIEISSDNVTFWENYSYVYKRMYELGMDGADIWALKGFEKALVLDPNNPVLRSEMGKVYSLQSDKLAENEKASKLSQAEETLNDALVMKMDYPDAMTEMALVYIKMNKKSEALQKVNEASSQKNISISTAVQIAKAYYNLEEKERAAEVLNVIINKNPKISDAHYILGLIYKEQERYEESLEEFKVVLELNPGNSDVSAKIKELEELIQK